MNQIHKMNKVDKMNPINKMNKIDEMDQIHIITTSPQNVSNQQNEPN